jgi:hypothetical protein
MKRTNLHNRTLLWSSGYSFEATQQWGRKSGYQGWIPEKAADGAHLVRAVLASSARDGIVLCRIHGNEYLHLVKAIQGGRFQIGNNRGFINGWIRAGAIYGRCIRIEM